MGWYSGDWASFKEKASGGVIVAHLLLSGLGVVD